MTATEKWLDPWFCKLSIVDRLFWIYLCDNCDHAGIWQVNELLVKMYFPGYEVNPANFGDRIKVLTDEKWFLTKFAEFQYKQLNPKNKVHASVLVKLEKEGVYKPLASPLQAPKKGLKNKNKNKKRLLLGEPEGVAASPTSFVKPSLEDCKVYAKLKGYSWDVEAFYDHFETRDWIPKGYTKQMKNWKSAMGTWNRYTNQSKQQQPEKAIDFV